MSFIARSNVLARVSRSKFMKSGGYKPIEVLSERAAHWT